MTPRRTALSCALALLLPLAAQAGSPEEDSAAASSTTAGSPPAHAAQPASAQPASAQANAAQATSEQAMAARASAPATGVAPAGAGGAQATTPPLPDPPPVADIPPVVTSGNVAVDAGADGGSGTGPAAAAEPVATTDTGAAPGTGLAIYQSFRAGMAEPRCDNADGRWRRHFAHAPQRLGDPDSDTLALFGHVVETLREAGLPTEFALIPFVESGYLPGARSKAGPAGLWQFITPTARHHGIRIEPGYDGRLSPAESTRAATRYLKSLYQRFDGDWRLAVMAYNAGEYRVLRGLRQGGANGSGDPARVAGLAPVTYAYVDKLHALACLLEQAGQRQDWLAGLDQPVPRLEARTLEGARTLDAWASANGHDPASLRRLNPALARQWPSAGAPLALVPPASAAPVAPGAAAAPGADGADASAGNDTPASAPATHTVRRGDSAWTIARRYGLAPRRLLEINGLRSDSVLRPGMVLRLE